MWPGNGKLVPRSDVLGDWVGDDGGGFPAHDGARRRLDRVDDAGGVGCIWEAGARAHGKRAVQHGQCRPEHLRRFAGGTDDGEGNVEPEMPRALGEDILVGEDDERVEHLVAALQPRPTA